MSQFPFFEKPLQNSPRLCMSLFSLLALGFILLIRDLYSNAKAVGVGAHATEWMWTSQDNLQKPAYHMGFRDQARVFRPGVAVKPVYKHLFTALLGACFSFPLILVFSEKLKRFLQKCLGKLGGFKV